MKKKLCETVKKKNSRTLTRGHNPIMQVEKYEWYDILEVWPKLMCAKKYTSSLHRPASTADNKPHVNTDIWLTAEKLNKHFEIDNHGSHRFYTFNNQSLFSPNMIL